MTSIDLINIRIKELKTEIEKITLCINTLEFQKSEIIRFGKNGNWVLTIKE